MDRRRVPARPASSEELECWSHAAKSLTALSSIYAKPDAVDTIHRVNKLIASWPSDDLLPTDGYDAVKSNHKRLSSGLKDLRSHAEEELKAIDDAIERIGVLVALRQASESLPTEKRNKRPRAPSQTSTTPAPGTISLSLNARAAPAPVQARVSVGPSPAVPFSREPKARREALAKQLPLLEGRKVAFHPPVGKPGEGASGDADENTWILAVVTKCINQDKNRYEVQDAEPQEDGQPGQCYNTTLRAIIPLPDPNAPPHSAAHLNAYQEFHAGSTVMALYPDTSCFYRAEVIASPRDMQPAGRGTSSKHIPMYKLKFEDDDDQEHSVHAQWVVEWPGN